MTWSRPRPTLALGLALLLAAMLAGPAANADPFRAGKSKPKKETFEGEVLAMTRTNLIVRSRDNYNIVRTFTYDQKLADKIAKLIDRNQPYQHGDRVEVRYLAGTTKAVEVKGKPGQKR
ncbi:MAG: hypothetical protein ACE5IP_07180 [Terriglobia bacterium]